MGHKIPEVFLFDSITNFESECVDNPVNRGFFILNKYKLSLRLSHFMVRIGGG